MSEHVLKTWPNAFESVRSGRKRFEWRKDDRGFEVGDVLLLREYDPTTDEFTNLGRWNEGFEPNELRARVTYILRGLFDIPSGYCVMSIELESKP